MFYLFTIMGAIFLAWALKIGNEYLHMQSNRFEIERYRYIVYRKHFFIPFYIYSKSKNETLRRKCKIYNSLFILYVLASIPYAILKGSNF